MTDQSNAQFNELCALTTKLSPEYGARPAAFAAACRERPDLAAAAIYPTGDPVIKGSKAAEKSAAGTRGAVESDASGLGTAKPWKEIMAALDGR